MLCVLRLVLSLATFSWGEKVYLEATYHQDSHDRYIYVPFVCSMAPFHLGAQRIKVGQIYPLEPSMLQVLCYRTRVPIHSDTHKYMRTIYDFRCTCELSSQSIYRKLEYITMV
ncbi:hypothetical protein EI94DRAFT_67620 [Lactarius quietus]|nr:hypothetical protein EI94DRAFT_67620 [Lactarius quietus]